MHSIRHGDLHDARAGQHLVAMRVSAAAEQRWVQFEELHGGPLDVVQRGDPTVFELRSVVVTDRDDAGPPSLVGCGLPDGGDIPHQVAPRMPGTWQLMKAEIDQSDRLAY